MLPPAEISLLSAIHIFCFPILGSDLTKMWPRLTFIYAVQILVRILEFFLATATAETNSTDDSTLLFFYSPVLDYCQWGDTSFWAPNNTANGGVCAYIPAKKQLYACPAPNPYVYSTSRCFQYMYHQNLERSIY